MKTIAWIVLIAVLFISTFGLSFCIVFFAAVIIFFIGGTSYVHLYEEQFTERYLERIIHFSYATNYLRKVSEHMKKKGKKYNFDSRLTGSHVIDEELQLIMYYVFRDFVYPWYNIISDDQEFPYQLKETAQKIIISLANRIKEVDWIPFVTTKLVDDFASHLRLYKQARAKMKNAGVGNLETYFFDLEFTMESGLLCRDHICMNVKEERFYLQHIAEAVLYKLFPVSDFNCKPFRFLFREILVEVILLPILSMISDPDYVNQTIIWLCSDFPVSSEIFLTVLKTTNNVDELHATRSTLKKEITHLRCKDAGNNNDTSIKNQLNSLEYVDKIIDIRLSRLQEGSDRDSTGLPASVDYSKLLLDSKLVQLSLDDVLKNGIALSYFIDYLSSANLQIYIDAFYNLEEWKKNAQEKLIRLNSLKDSENYPMLSSTVYEHLKKNAQSLYEQFLSEKCIPKLIPDSVLQRSLHVRLYTEVPCEEWFDDVTRILYDTLENDEKFLPSFRNRPSYAKLLVELELLREPLLKENEEEAISADEMISTSSGESSLLGSPVKLQTKDSMSIDSITTEESPGETSEFTLSAKIIETGLLQENGKTFGVYAIAVTKLFREGKEESWHIYRRYSDFYELHQKIKERYPNLASIPFPGKKAFNNMDRNVLEKRMKMLNSYLQILLHQEVKSYASLHDMLIAFLQPMYDKGGPGGPLAKTFDSLVINPLKLVGNAVKTMPDNLLNTVDGVVEGFSRVFTKQFRNEDEEETMKVSSEIDNESDNIPLRIMILLMTEIFDLKTRNQWLRKRIIFLMRQIMHAMFGDIVNKRILDYVAVITSPSRVALCLANIKNSLWPNSVRAEPMPPRDHDIRMQTRVAAKCAMLASFSDDLKHILGSETSRSGLMLLFSMFQHEVLNKRLVYVFLEGFLVALFPNLITLFHKLHAQSPRVSCKKKKKSRK